LYGKQALQGKKEGVMMLKFTYTFDKPLRLQTAATTKAEADARLAGFNQKLNELAENMRIVLDKGTSIRCQQDELE
jgi:hypothetical protein